MVSHLKQILYYYIWTNKIYIHTHIHKYIHKTRKINSSKCIVTFSEMFLTFFTDPYYTARNKSSVLHQIILRDMNAIDILIELL